MNYEKTPLEFVKQAIPVENIPSAKFGKYEEILRLMLEHWEKNKWYEVELPKELFITNFRSGIKNASFKAKVKTEVRNVKKKVFVRIFTDGKVSVVKEKFVPDKVRNLLQSYLMNNNGITCKKFHELKGNIGYHSAQTYLGRLVSEGFLKGNGKAPKTYYLANGYTPDYYEQRIIKRKKKMRTRDNKQWTEAEDKILEDMWRKGNTTTKMAKRLMRKENSIRQRIRHNFYKGEI